jgi:hypothetical protein
MNATPVRAVLFAVVALLSAASVIACSGTVVTPAAPKPGSTGHGGSKIGRGAHFVAILPPLSPDSPYTLPSYALPQNRAAFRHAASSSLIPVSDHWFFLVNGYQLATPIPGRPGSAPVPQTTPFVLAVNGALPNGAPGPNGGMAVGVVPLGAASGATLWKIVPVAPGNTNPRQGFFLRSEESFLPLQPSVSGSPVPNVKPSAGLYPSLLTGWAASDVDLDLGVVPNWNTGVYMNQNVYPFAGGVAATNFQQWFYNPSNGTLNNGNGGSLTMSCAMPITGQSCVGTQSPSGAVSRWYAYPNYKLSLVLAEPTPGPAFPMPSVTSAPGGAGTTDVKGEVAAYYYISSKALGTAIQLLPHCTIPEQTGPPGNTYYGIRCVYVNVNDTSYISTCASVAATQNAPSGAQPYNPGNPTLTATISAADWAVVSAQMNSECAYVGGVMGTFATYNSVLSFIFTASSSQIGSIAAQINATQKVSFAATDLLEGIVYTVLNTITVNGFGIGGVLGNLMQTTIDVSQAKKTGLASPLTATAATLYNQLDTAITNDQSTLGLMEEGIVWNWNRLSQIGPLTFDDGPNGLGISTTNGDVPAMEQAGLAAYETVFLQMFYPQAYGLMLNPGQTSSSIKHVASYDIGTSSTFGSTTGSLNVSVLCQLSQNSNDWFKHCPSASLMAAPTPLPQQSQFALFNGLNGWSAIPRSSSTFQGLGTMVDVFNATPNLLSVTAIPQNDGYVAAPGANFSVGSGFNKGSQKPYTSTLFPYGYVPIYAGAYNSSHSMQLTVKVSSGSMVVGSFFLKSADETTVVNATNVNTAAGWSFLPSPVNGAYTYPFSNLQPAYPKSVLTSPATMWVVIAQ